MSIGAGTFLNLGVMVASQELVEIGDHCMLANGCFVSDASHRYDDLREADHLAGLREQRADSHRDNCWLGANVVVTSGVSIGERCVIGANSVVTRDVEPFSIAAGAPARLIRRSSTRAASAAERRRAPVRDSLRGAEMTGLRITTRVFSRCRLILAGLLAVSLGAAGCGGGGSAASTSTPTAQTVTSPAAAAALIHPASLVPTGAMQGFTPSGAMQTATSPQGWAQSSAESDEVAHEAARLTSAGLREGVGQHYTGTAGAAALSLALVFNSPEGAKKEVTHYLQVDPRYGLHLESEKVAAIPGAIVVGEGPAGNVLFTTGRCFVLVGDKLGASFTPSQVNAVPIAAATALYNRVKSLCAAP